MNMQVLVKRKAVAMRFSRDFEAKLLTLPTDHISLTHDLELQAIAGLGILEELEDIHDIKHIETLQKLVAVTNEYLKIESRHFTSWHINIAEDILDEVDLIILAHGEDLLQLGLQSIDQGAVVMLLATAALLQTSLR